MKGLNWKAAIIPAILIVPFAVLLGRQFGRDPHALPDTLTGRPAKIIEASTLDGGPFVVGGTRDKPMVLNFWATYCVPCRYEHPLLQQASQAFAKDVEFVGVVYDDDPALVKAYLEKEPTSYPHLIDAEGELALAFKVTAVPETVFLSSDGVVVRKIEGQMQPGMLYGAINEVMKEP